MPARLSCSALVLHPVPPSRCLQQAGNQRGAAAGVVKPLLITKLLQHFKLSQPASAPYSVVAHLRAHAECLGRMNVLLARAGDAQSQLWMRLHPGGSTADGQLFTRLPASAMQALAARYADPQDMAGRLAALDASPSALRLHDSCGCGSCYVYGCLDSDEDYDGW